ncbi:YihY/virulence factor BrkB family protein [Actinospica durhamensis]|uniref:YihY/virulence factor BrkB family protein n=1 Tax=Actinospica durhamensis TaxID=1508375 RepID=A0A941EW96_9ACTN|nr:YhjD/YihY/BrkB family envelope integrity protein [Actinospica durhamensis]MBR7838116.1 YihY/virulence factor BrkB family protein [Actinospica durhamensis]
MQPRRRNWRPSRWPERPTVARAVQVGRRSSELELMHRALGFAALGFVAMMPLLIVIADASPVDYGGFGQWVADSMGLSGQSEHIVKELFAQSRGALSSTDVLGLVVVCVFGQSFASSVQTGYEKAWDLRPQLRHRLWQQVLWLATLTGQLYVVALSSHSVHAWTGLIRGVLWIVLFWWGQWILLGGRIPWRALLPGAILTMIGLFGLRIFSRLVFAPMVVDAANTYGAVGTVLIVVTWMVGLGFVVFGAALLGEQCRRDRLIR